VQKILSQKYFQKKNTVALARGLLGKFLVRRYRGKTSACLITEVEAYTGFSDKASHAHRGKTERNKVMFGPAGHWYVYFTYGMHWLLNIVTGPTNYPSAILIRSIRIAHPKRSQRTTLLDGPAKLTKALYIDGKLNGKPANKKSGLWIEDRGIKTKASQIESTPRIGVAYAGPTWSKKRWRFVLK